MAKALITFLGTVGLKNQEGKPNKKSHYFRNFPSKIDGLYINMLPLEYEYYKDYDIIPLYTVPEKDPQNPEKPRKGVKEINEEVLEDAGLDPTLIAKNGRKIANPNNHSALFKLINDVAEPYDELVVDVTHGFRHMPILMMINLIIKNFSNPYKIKEILFAQDGDVIEGVKQFHIVGLSNYLNLASISFILNNFSKNYTIASHIDAAKVYKSLTDKLQDLAGDLMTLNVAGIRDCALGLLDEIDAIKDKDENIAIKDDLTHLASIVGELADTTDIITSQNPNGKIERYASYLALSKIMREKYYTLNALALLFEGAKEYVVYLAKLKNPAAVQKRVEKYGEYKRYDLCEYFSITKIIKMYKQKKSAEGSQCITKEEELQEIEKIDLTAILKELRGYLANGDDDFGKLHEFLGESIAKHGADFKFEYDLTRLTSEILTAKSTFLGANVKPNEKISAFKNKFSKAVKTSQSTCKKVEKPEIKPYFVDLRELLKKIRTARNESAHVNASPNDADNMLEKLKEWQDKLDEIIALVARDNSNLNIQI